MLQSIITINIPVHVLDAPIGAAAVSAAAKPVCYWYSHY